MIGLNVFGIRRKKEREEMKTRRRARETRERERERGRAPKYKMDVEKYSPSFPYSHIHTEYVRGI
jgi:hypothetical protein